MVPPTGLLPVAVMSTLYYFCRLTINGQFPFCSGLITDRSVCQLLVLISEVEIIENSHLAKRNTSHCQSSSSSSCSLSVRRFSCSLILKVELVPPSLLWSSHVPSSFRSVSQCLYWCPTATANKKDANSCVCNPASFFRISTGAFQARYKAR
jgi:hypothetical protein